MNLPTILIDADTGIDDALAILYALKSGRANVVGITTAYGNTPVEQATDNTLRIVKLAGFENAVPVSMGASRPLAREAKFAAHVHGSNGIGDVELPPSSQTAIAEPAADFIVRMANEHQGELTIVTLGRLTNLALALEKDPKLPTKVKHLYAMGGAVRVPGNVTPTAEANIWGDPDAADIVFRSGLNVTMVGLDVTLRTRLHQSDLDNLKRTCRADNRDVVDFIERSMQFYFHFYEQANGYHQNAPMHDPLAMLAAIESGIVSTETMKLSVECQGTHCIGMTVADLRNNPSVGYPVQVAVDVREEQAIARIIEAFR